MMQPVSITAKAFIFLNYLLSTSTQSWWCKIPVICTLFLLCSPTLFEHSIVRFYIPLHHIIM